MGSAIAVLEDTRVRSLPQFPDSTQTLSWERTIPTRDNRRSCRAIAVMEGSLETNAIARQLLLPIPLIQIV